MSLGWEYYCTSILFSQQPLFPLILYPSGMNQRIRSMRHCAMVVFPSLWPVQINVGNGLRLSQRSLLCQRSLRLLLSFNSYLPSKLLERDHLWSWDVISQISAMDHHGGHLFIYLLNISPPSHFKWLLVTYSNLSWLLDAVGSKWGRGVFGSTLASLSGCGFLSFMAL